MADETRAPHRREERGFSRRDFLQVGAVGGLASVALGGAAQLAAAAEHASDKPTAATSQAAASNFEFAETTIADLQTSMQAGKLTSVALCKAYLERIQVLDPQLHSVLETNPEALAIAAQLDAERKAGKVRGPLHGIPVLIKDNIATSDKMMTTAGSLALVGATPARDAFVAERLRAAGAVLLGKTNLSEWANFRSTQASSGWSGRGGQCRNPYVLDRSPCGSSSGTGAAIAANFAAAGVGSETDGSIVCPSGMCSLVGIKPTLGLVSRSGIIPIAHSQDTAGPMARTVADAATLLGALAGADAADAATAASAGKIAPDYTQFLDPNGLKGARIGVARAKLFGYSPEADKLVEAAIADLKRLGAVIVDPADIPHLGEYDDTELAVLLYEFKTDIELYFAGLAGTDHPKTLQDLIEFNDKNRDREMLYFGQELFLQAQAKGPLTDKAYIDALAKNHQLARDEGIDAVMKANQLDAIVAPTGSPAWPIDLVNGDHFLGASSTPGAVAGYPSITVPVGYSFGLPISMTFIGSAWSEGTLIKLAYAYEQAVKARRPPRFLPTLDASKA